MRKDITLEEMTDDEFADFVNKSLDAIDKVVKITYIDDIVDKKAKIERDKNNYRLNQQLEREDTVNIQNDFRKVKAREKEAAKYSSTSYKSIEQLKINFKNAIADQVREYKKYLADPKRMNPRYETENALVPGVSRQKELEKKKPVVHFYFDRSGSWTSDKRAIEIGESIVALIQSFADSGDIELKVYYFSNNITTDKNDSMLGGGTRAWNKILQNIKATNANNVVLMTDSDMGDDAENGPLCKVRGGVWFIWNMRYDPNGTNQYDQQARNAIFNHLVGAKGNRQYAFN